MNDQQQEDTVISRLGLKKTNSLYVSEAFSFLNDSEFQDADDETKNVSEAEVSNLGNTGLETEESAALNGMPVTPEATKNEYTIITSLENLPPPQCSGGLYGSGDRNQDQYISPVADSTHARDEPFTIVTYVEEPAGDSASEKFGHVQINPVYDTSDVQIPDQVGESSHDTTIDITKSTTDRNSILVEGELVELRRSPDARPLSRHSRLPTWKSNQNVVSEAFHFLKEVTELDGVEDVDNDIGVNSQIDMDISSREDIAVLNAGGINGRTIDKTKVLKKGAAICEDYSDIHPIDRVSEHVSKMHLSPAISTNGTPTGLETSVITSLLQEKICGTDGTNSEVSYSGSSENDEVDELRGIRKRGGKKNRPSDQSENTEDNGDSSDEDTGVYRESFRKSTWLYIGDNKDVKKDSSSNYVSLADLGINTCDNDSIFGDDTNNSEPDATQPIQASHKRNDSTATTASEHDFKNRYNSVHKRYVQRANSQQEYRRYTAKFFENVKSFIIEKEVNAGYGIHILDSMPAIISGIDAESPAELAGVKEGQVVISVNGVNVIESDHSKIIQLVHENSTKLMLDVGCGDVSNVVNLQMPVHSGYLLKQVSSSIFKSWKKRFFILRRDNCLYYYKTEQDTDPLGAIPLNGFVFSRHGDINKFGFKAEKYGSKTFYFMADNRDDLTSWVGSLNESAQLTKNKKDSWMDVTTQNVGLPALDIRKPDCVGYLYKMGRATKRWRKRYCVLKDACIYHYKNSNSKEAVGVAHLHGYRVDSDAVTGKKNSFCLHPPETQMRVFSFYTDNNTDKMRWVQALNTSIQKWVRVD